jgi:predicted Fe-Mo cluster-binding NifX family protein
MDNTEYKYTIAVATSDGIVVNRHFGKAEQFLVLALDAENQIHRLEMRSVNPVCAGGTHEDDRLEKAADSLTDCKYVLVSRIGQGAAQVLEQKGITPMELPGMIEDSVQKLVQYEEIQKLLTPAS